MLNKFFSNGLCNLKNSIKLSTSNAKFCQKVHSGELQDLDQISKDKLNFFKKVDYYLDKTKNQRNFAVIHLYGYQHLVHEGDVIQIKKDMPLKLGERIKIEKCLLAGNDYVTLVGRPLLDRNKVNIEITAIEKTQSHTLNDKVLITTRNQGKKKLRFYRKPITFLRVNEITIN